MTPAMAERVATMRLVITPAGVVQDRDGGRYPTIRVVQRPQPMPQVTQAPTRKRAPRKRKTTS
jgi:hypothetical protein